MADSLDKKYLKEFTFDLPVTYNEVELHPIMMSDYFDFMMVHNVLKMRKNDIDPRFISMSYLDFLIDMFQSHDLMGEMYRIMFSRCMFLTTQSSSIISFGKDKKGKSYIEIGGMYFNSKQFDEFRDLILHQNLPDYEDNSRMDAQLLKDLEEVNRLKSQNKKMVSLEKQIISVMTNTSMPLDKIYEMSIRKFILTLEMVDKKMHYIIYKTASMSGMVKFKKEIEHYMFETSNGLEGRVIEADEVINKIKSTNL